MNMIVDTALLVALAAAAGSDGSQSGVPLMPEDFARGAALRASGDDPIVTALVPLDVHRTVIRGDLGDLRVFNRKGEVVPHAITTLDRRLSSVGAPVSLPIFPLFADKKQALDDLKLHIEHTENSTVIDVAAALPKKNVGELRAYIIDVRGVAGPLDWLEMDWEPPQENVIARAHIAGANDLGHWRGISSGTLAHLVRGNSSVQRRRISLGRSEVKFLRLSWAEGPPPFAFTGAAATAAPTKKESERQTLELIHTSKIDSTGERTVAAWVYDTEALLPIDRLNVALPEPNTFVVAQVYSSKATEGPWRKRHHGPLYRMALEGEEFSSPPIEVDRGDDRYWKIVVDTQGGGLGSADPVLTVRWYPKQLIFAARGGGPYLLAYGSHKAGKSALNAAALVGAVPGRAVEDLEESSAQVAASRDLAGAVALRAPVPPVSWKKWILWAVLVFGVIVLGMMAMQLILQMNAPPGDA